MIILDTHIISEMMKPVPAEQILLWLDQQEASKLYLTTVTIAEIVYAINAVPKGKRRQTLEANLQKTMIEGFKYRILSFNELAAHLYGQLMGERREAGSPISAINGQIAAIALAHDAAIATSNVSEFANCGIKIIDPLTTP